MTKLFPILFTVISMAVMAVAGIIEPAHAAARRSTPTTCVTGPPASTSGYVIEYAAVGDPAAGNRFYDIDPAFSSAHSVGSAMVSHSTPCMSSVSSTSNTSAPDFHLLKLSLKPYELQLC